jgi:disulfide bond formation protein DsbB
VISVRLDSAGRAGYEVYRPDYPERIRTVTTDTPAIPHIVRSEAAAATQAALAIMLIAAATLAGAWFFQLVLEILPCPLCLEQRYAYYFAVPLAGLLALAASRGAPRGLVLAGLAILALAALGNSILGGYHAGVEWKFWSGPTDCTGTGFNPGKAGSLFDNLDKVKVVRCDEVQFRFLGISLAGYNVLISLVMAAIAAWGFAKTARR